LAQGFSIYTIGHSNRSIEFFIGMLRSFGIQVLADVRSMPGSKYNPQFNRAALMKSLEEAGIKYLHFPGLGGKQTGLAGYGAYMKTPLFGAAIKELEQTAQKEKVAYMCAEAGWQQCHRAFISDFLKSAGWEVIHITDVGKSIPHPESRPAKPKQGDLFVI
jgi:uncharacterized protein (DUF488 family)